MKSNRTIIDLSNGYRLSLITNSEFYYCNKDTFEVAVLKKNSIDCYEITYEFSEDVWGYQTPAQVLSIIKTVSEKK